MEFPNAYRVLLIGLLPAVAILIYYEGQHYNPALIRFQLSPSAENNTPDFFPDETGTVLLLFCAHFLLVDFFLLSLAEELLIII